MIVFTIAFGEKYIRRFFRRALPSLLSRDNLPSLTSEPLSLVVFTMEEDFTLVGEEINVCVPDHVFGAGILVLKLPQSEIAGKVTADRSGGHAAAILLTRAVEYCLHQKEAFLHATADLLYENGVVNHCWNLHKLTGKVVSIFNGRVDTPKDGQSFEAVMKSPNGLRDYFFRHRADIWRKWTTTSHNHLPESPPNHLIYETPNQTFLFCGLSNPFIGSFAPDDLKFFKNGRGMRAWDHEWSDHLLASNRLLVQTNLDLGLSIEPSEPGCGQDGRPILQRTSEGNSTNQMGAMNPIQNSADLVSRRQVKFSGPHSTYCFTTTRCHSSMS